MRKLRSIISTLFGVLLALMSCHQAFALTIDGPGILGVHDPSRMIKCHDTYYVYSTGSNIPMHYSKDMIHWEHGPGVLGADRKVDGIPAWERALVPGNKGNGVWAPDLLFFHGQYHLYYSFSDWDTNDSVIALVTSPTLDPNDPKYHWTDQGEVMRSDSTTPYGAIDPCPIFDKSGNLWLTTGSLAKGERLIQLDKTTGLRSTTNTKIYELAGNRGEATYIHFHDGYYYLFKNIGGCCNGASSTYRIYMGRAKEITGPYCDKDGTDMNVANGTLLIESNGDIHGPGHIGIYHDGKVDWMSFFYYQANKSTLGIKTLTWGRDGWPVVGPGLSDTP